MYYKKTENIFLDFFFFTYEGLTIILSSVRPAALRMADTQLVRIPDVIADKITLLSSQDCKLKIY